jgi:hypothetical protein
MPHPPSDEFAPETDARTAAEARAYTGHVDDTLYEKLWPWLWPKGSRPNVWAVIDCARDPLAWSTLYASTLLRECLYAGTLSPKLERVAPYLVQLEFADPQTIRLLNRSWGQSWGIFLRCGATMKTLRKHLRKFLRVTGPAGKPLVFRYYDPRVMRVFLPTCSGTQLDELFGPIDCISCEEGDPDRMFEFRLDDQRRKLLTSEVALEACLRIGPELRAIAAAALALEKTR